VDTATPVRSATSPVGRPILREILQRFADDLEGNACALNNADDRNAAQHGAVVTPSKTGRIFRPRGETCSMSASPR